MRRAPCVLALLAASAAANELKDFLPLASLSKAAPHDVHAVDWSAVPPDALKRLNADDLKMLTYCAGMSGAQVVNIPSKIVNTLDPGCVASLAPTTFAQMEYAQLLQLSGRAAPAVRAAQVGALPVASCAAFAKSDLFKHFTVELCSGITAECLRAMPEADRKVLTDPACVSHALPASQEVLKTTPLTADPQEAAPAAQQTTALVSVHVESAQQGKPHPDQQQQATLTEDVLKGSASCAAITADAWAKVDTKVLSHMTGACVSTIPPAAFAGITAAGLALVPKAVIQKVTVDQVRAMHPETCAMFAATDSFEHLPVAVCAGLSPLCVAAAGPKVEVSTECMGLVKAAGAQPERAAAVHLRMNTIKDILPGEAVEYTTAGGGCAAGCTIVKWDAVPPAVVASFNGDALKMITNCAKMSGEQAAAIPAEMLVDLTPACLGTLPPASFAEMSVKQLFSLPVNALAALTAGQLAALPAAKCAAFFQADAFDTIAACSGITPACLKTLRQEDVETLAARAACVKQLQPLSRAVFDARLPPQPTVNAVKLAAAVPSFVPEEAVSQDNPAQVAWGRIEHSLFSKMTVDDMAMMQACGELSAAQVGAIPPENFAVIPETCVATLAPAVFAGLTSKQVGYIPQATVVAGVTAEQLGRMELKTCDKWFADVTVAAKFVGISLAQEALTPCLVIKSHCEGVAPEAVAQLNVGLVKDLLPACYTSLNKAAFQAIRPDQLNHLAPAHAKATTAEQMSWLTADQCAQLAGGDFVKYQTGAACAGVAADCVAAMGAEAVKYLAGGEACRAQLTPAAKAAIPPTAMAQLRTSSLFRSADGAPRGSGFGYILVVCATIGAGMFALSKKRTATKRQRAHQYGGSYEAL